jgi:hypothetical protein
MAKPKDADIVTEAQKRFDRCEKWEATARTRWLEDLKFCNADSYNLYQWPKAVLENRGIGTADERPHLTINKTRQHCLQVINDARQNKSSIKIVATGDKATKEAADVMEGLVRHIEYISNAQAAYGTAIRYQVQAGLGYARVVTDYAGDDTLDQDIFIKRVKDPLSVYLDPDISEADGSDARFGFVFDDVPRDVFNAKYPRYKETVGTSPLGNSADTNWNTEDHVRVAEYYRKVEDKRDKRVFVRDPQTGEEIEGLLSEVPPEVRPFVVDDPARQRDVVTYKIEWFLIAGDKIVERRDWLGKYIPIVPWPGETTVIDGTLDRKGHTRALMDAQRDYNYNASAAVEYGALQSKIPWTAPAEAIEGYETYWETANTVNHSILPYNALRDDGTPIPAPQRVMPPVAAPVFIQGMVNAAEDMRLVSGQYQAEMGAPSNETSGVAIERRQRQGDNATYHYIDHQAMAMRFLGKIIVDLIPKIYETRRVMKIMAEDGSATDVTIDPRAQAAHQVVKAHQQDVAEQVIFNPNIGKYDVEVDVGPAFATRRQEQFAALSQIASQNKEVMAVAGDLIMQAADFPMAEELAERLKRTIPPNILGEETAEAPQVAQLQQQLQAMQSLMGQMAQKLADKDAELKLKADQKRIDAYDAETRRLSSLGDYLGSADPDGVVALVRREIREALGSPGAMDEALAAQTDPAAPMMPQQPQPAPAPAMEPAQ